MRLPSPLPRYPDSLSPARATPSRSWYQLVLCQSTWKACQGDEDRIFALDIRLWPNLKLSLAGAGDEYI
jgi:hypothetical protein